jgi:diaminopimelate epimerase
VTDTLRWLKGHGTENDFVLLPEAGDLPARLVAALCDRHAGIGADGVLRVVPAGGAGGAKWFMDYRNADGSLAEMCGNGIRVFARYLVDAGLVEPGEFEVDTRAGVKTVWAPAVGAVRVDMGAPELLGGRPVVGEVTGTAVSMGNPHVVVALPPGDRGLAELGALRLEQPPVVTPGLPGGQNVEFVVRTGPRSVALRVHERGVGETRSCGTGVCAAVVATVAAGGSGRGEEWAVDVPGGRLAVTWGETVLLTGPAVLVAAGEIRPGWLRAYR